MNWVWVFASGHSRRSHLYLVKSLSELGLGFCIRTQQAVTQVDQSTFECSCQHENRLFKVFVTICPLQKYAPRDPLGHRGQIVQRATINTLNTRHAHCSNSPRGIYRGIYCDIGQEHDHSVFFFCSFGSGVVTTNNLPCVALSTSLRNRSQTGTNSAQKQMKPTFVLKLTNS